MTSNLNTPSPPAPDHADPEEVRRTLAVLHEPGQVTELRILDAVEPGYRSPHTVSGYFDNPDALIDAIETIQTASGFYLVPNPVDPALLARAANRLTVAKRGAGTTDANIISRRWLLIDLDPIRLSGISSTDAEHEAALSRARAIARGLSELGWPDPVLADSGNGAHLLYRIDLPPDDGGLVKRVLAALAFRFDDATVIVDQTTHNAARIWKLYGTPVRKGDHVPERPHRLARLLQVPDVVQEVSVSQLQALAASVPVPPSASTARATMPHPVSTTEVGDGLDLTRWLADHNLQAYGPIPWQDGQKWILPVCPWNPEHTNRSAYVVQLGNGAVAAGCHHHSCAQENWHSLRDLLKPGWHTARVEAMTASANGVGDEPASS
jgi:hypothetical protein